MSKHTPGPWAYIEGNVFDRFPQFIGPSGEQVCHFGAVDDDFESGKEPMEADARLIAAAPELLAALEALLAGEGYADGEGVWCVDRAGDGVVEVARAAIVKARGEQS